MTIATGRAPAKVILVGEHAVVYGRPAVAAPVWELQATVSISPRSRGAGCLIRAYDTGQQIVLRAAAEREPLALVTRLALAKLALEPDPDWLIEVRSPIPIASGMGSGASVSAALVRALFACAHGAPDDATVSDLVYASEEVHHGTPSGIDNTVVAYGKPVWFIRGQEPEVFVPLRPFMLAIAGSGTPSSTRTMVDGVRARRKATQKVYEECFDEIGDIATAARRAIEAGHPDALGQLFDANQALLERIGVSTPGLEKLTRAARDAGAGGAKLSGAGGGGNVIALVTVETAPTVSAALLAAGAKRVIVTTVDARSST